MVFCRVSVEFGTSHPSPSLVDVSYDNEVAGDIGLQDLSTDEINSVGYFTLASDQSALLPGAFSYTISSPRTREGQHVTPLPTPSPPVRLMRRSPDTTTAASSSSSSNSADGGTIIRALRISPSWAQSGLCITGFQSAPSPVIQCHDVSVGEPVQGPNEGFAASINCEEFAFSSSWPSPSENSNQHPPTPSHADDPDHDQPLVVSDLAEDDDHLEFFDSSVSDSPRLVSFSLDDDDGDDEEDQVLDDFVGVLNVGHPLRPSEACHDLAGLAGLGISLGMTQPGGDDDDVYSMTPDSEAILATRVPSSPSFWDPEIMNSRELFVIAEEDDEDWHSPSDSEGCSTPVSPLDLDRNNENQPQNYATLSPLTGSDSIEEEDGGATNFPVPSQSSTSELIPPLPSLPLPSTLNSNFSNSLSSLSTSPRFSDVESDSSSTVHSVVSASSTSGNY